MQPNSSALLTLLNQFKAHYPMGSIVAELLTIHQESYVVRALIQVGSVSLASGMATNPDLELAEDRAKVRALQAFGLSLPDLNPQPETFPGLPPDPRVNYSPPELPDLTPASPPEDLLAPPIAPQEAVVPKLPQTVLETPAQPTADLAIAPNFGLPFSLDSDRTLTSDLDIQNLDTQNLDEPLDTLPELPLPVATVEPPASPPAKSEKSAKRKTEPPAEKPEAKPASAGEAGDRSNEIARIGVEMKRLGWTTEQGRNYLRRTYGKRSRQELDDVELLDFLRFLETQPSPTESLF